MAFLADLPKELLIIVLDYLAYINPRALLRCQATSRTLALLVRDITSERRHVNNARALGVRDGLAGAPRVLTLDIPSLLAEHFGPLFKSEACFTKQEHKTIVWGALDGQLRFPFQRLHWARHERLRKVFLRPEASWRHLSVTFGCGPPVTHLDIFKRYMHPPEDAVPHHLQLIQLDLSSSSGSPAHHGFLTMGVLYDLLLRDGPLGANDAATFLGSTNSWELLLGKRVRSFDLLTLSQHLVIRDDRLVDSGPGAARSAILYVMGGWTPLDDEISHVLTFEGLGDQWIPEPLQDDAPRLLPWQGPLRRRQAVHI